jgi:hypothetical protein
MTLSPDAIHDLNWWYPSMSSAYIYNPILVKVNYTLYYNRCIFNRMHGVVHLMT